MNSLPERRDVEGAAERLLENARKDPEVLGADVVWSAGAGTRVSLRDGEIEEDSVGLSCGMGLRTILRDGRQGIAFVNGFDRTLLEGLTPWSRTNAALGTPDPCVALYAGPLGGNCLDLESEDPAVFSLTSRQRMAFALEMTEAARAEDSRLVSVRSASWSDGWGELFYASTTGISGWYRGTSAGCGVAVVLGEGEEMEMGWGGEHERHLADIDIRRSAHEAVRKASLTLGGKAVRTGRFDLVLDQEVTASLLDEIAELFLASNVQRNRSLLRGRMGEVVGGTCLTLVDDGCLPRREGSAPFDGEGVPTRRTVLLENGRVSAFLYDLHSACRDGVASTGSAVRGVASIPDVGMSNFFLQPGDKSHVELLSHVGDGLYITELMGMHTVNPASGEFSLGAKGAVIRGGALAEPFAGITIAGNLLDLLRQVSDVGGDLRFFGGTGGCSMVIRDVAVAGA